jgi:hypothetical protein
VIGFIIGWRAPYDVNVLNECTNTNNMTLSLSTRTIQVGCRHRRPNSSVNDSDTDANLLTRTQISGANLFMAHIHIYCKKKKVTQPYKKGRKRRKFS